MRISYLVIASLVLATSVAALAPPASALYCDFPDGGVSCKEEEHRVCADNTCVITQAQCIAYNANCD